MSELQRNSGSYRGWSFIIIDRPVTKINHPPFGLDFGGWRLALPEPLITSLSNLFCGRVFVSSEVCLWAASNSCSASASSWIFITAARFRLSEVNASWSFLIVYYVQCRARTPSNCRSVSSQCAQLWFQECSFSVWRYSAWCCTECIKYWISCDSPNGRSLSPSFPPFWVFLKPLVHVVEERYGRTIWNILFMAPRIKLIVVFSLTLERGISAAPHLHPDPSAGIWVKSDNHQCVTKICSQQIETLHSFQNSIQSKWKYYYQFDSWSHEQYIPYHNCVWLY